MEPEPFYKNPKVLAACGVAVLLLALAAYYFAVIKKTTTPAEAENPGMAASSTPLLLQTSLAEPMTDEEVLQLLEAASSLEPQYEIELAPATP